MEWLVQNWFWVVIGVLFVGMHLFGHGGHGRDGCGHGSHDASDKSGNGDAGPKNPSGHQH